MAQIISRLTLGAIGVVFIALVVFVIMAAVQILQGNHDGALNSFVNTIYSILALVLLSLIPNKMD